MSLNLSNIFNTFDSQYEKATTLGKENKSQSYTANGDSIFAVASAMVSTYKAETANTKNNSDSKSSGIIGGKNFAQIANMSTKDFLNYAYENKATSGFNDNASGTNGDISLPALVSYETAVVSTAGKSFMQVVSSLAAKFPTDSEAEIAAKLMKEYATPEQIEALTKQYCGVMPQNKQKTTGKSINLSA